MAFTHNSHLNEHSQLYVEREESDITIICYILRHSIALLKLLLNPSISISNISRLYLTLNAMSRLFHNFFSLLSISLVFLYHQFRLSTLPSLHIHIIKFTVINFILNINCQQTFIVYIVSYRHKYHVRLSNSIICQQGMSFRLFDEIINERK